jgi:hypothetical protein
MILGAEVALIVLGLYILIKGKELPNKKSKFIITGWPLRFMGIICLLPIPLSFLGGVALGIWWVMQGKDVKDRSFFWAGTALELSVLVLCLLAITIISRTYRIPVSESRSEDTVA